MSRQFLHQSHFYDSDESYVAQTCSYLGEGWDQDQGLLVFCGRTHWERICFELGLKGKDVKEKILTNDLMFFDVEHVILQVLDKDSLNVDAALTMLLPLLQMMKQQKPSVRMYSEITNSLMEYHNWKVALEMEEVLHEIQRTHQIDLCSGFNLHEFHHSDDGPVFDTICSFHDRIISPFESNEKIHPLQLKQRDLSLQYAHESMSAAEKYLHVGKASSELVHELMNPLSIAMMQNELLDQLMGDPETTREKQQAILKKQRKQIGRMAQILENVRSVNARQRLVFETVRLDQIIHQLAAHLAEEFKNLEIKLDVRFTLKCELTGNAMALEQVLLTLLHTARDAIIESNKPGTVIIDAAYTDQGHVQVFVQDNGAGMDQTRTKQVFTPFAGAKQAGSGLSLAMCRSIVEEHGGYLTCTSREGLGTTMTLTFAKATVL